MNFFGILDIYGVKIGLLDSYGCLKAIFYLINL